MYEGNVTVQDVPYKVTDRPAGRDFYIKNTGNNIVFLGSYPGALADSGFPLKPSDTKVWEAGDELYAACAGGLTSTLNVSLNAGALFSPGDIATEINAVGVPAINVSETLAEYQGASTLSISALTPYTTGILDVSKHQRIRVRWYESQGFTSGEVYREGGLTWYADPAGTIVIGNDLASLATDGQSDFEGPVKGPYVSFDTGVTSVASTGISLIITASYRGSNSNGQWEFSFGANPVDVDPLNDGSNGLFAYTKNAMPVSLVTCSPIHKSGPAILDFYLGQAVAAGYMAAYVIPVNSTKRLTTMYLPAGTATGYSLQRSIIFPKVPCQLQIQNATGGAMAVVSFTIQQG